MGVLGEEVTRAFGRSGQLSLDDELVLVLEQRAQRDRLASAKGAPAGDGARRLLRRLVQRGLSERALPVAAALVLALDSAVGEGRWLEGWAEP
jgi:hypothetical protein